MFHTKRAKLPCLILFIFLSVFLPASATEVFQLEEVQQFLAAVPTRQEIAETISELRSYIKNEPENYRNYQMLALIYDYVGEHKRALKALKTAVNYFPLNAEGADFFYGSLARQYIKLGKFDAAMPIIYKALTFNPGNLANRQYLLSYYIAKDMYQKAAEELKEISESDKNTDYYYNFYIYATHDLHKKGDKIIELFKAAAKINPKSYAAHRMLAIALRDHSTNIKKDFPKIIAELKKSLALNPRYIFTYISFADTYTFMGSETGKKTYFKKALEWLSKAYKREPQNVKLNLAMGNLFLSTDQYDKAIEKFEYVRVYEDESMPVTEGLICAYNNKADLYCKKGKKLAEGLEVIDKALKLKPEDATLLTTKAELLYKLKKYDDAYDCIKKAVILAPRNATVIEHFENIKVALEAARK